jgi:hypothetical protein
MTLNVARVTPLGVRMSADMRITDPGATAHGYSTAALKLVVTHPTLCIGYAGNLGVAVEAIREAATNDPDLDAITQHLLGVHLRTEGATDFLIGSVRPARLVMVKRGVAVEGASGWVGDPDAFEEYQRHYFSERLLLPLNLFETRAQAADIEVATRMSYAMQAVVFGDPIPQERVGWTRSGGVHHAVGEAGVNVVPRVEDGLFIYAELARAEASWSDAPLPPGLGVVPPDWGSPERGAFSYTMLTPTRPGIAAIGLYFHEGRLGMLYAPLVLDEPAVYPKMTIEAFAELVRLRHGIDFKWFGSGVRES